jgi:site-specific DNA-methyltransferase (adenine-specific)
MTDRYRKKPVVIGNATLYLGDCLEVMRELPDKSIDLILCDPPYGTTNCRWDSIIPLEPMWEQYERLLSPGGCVVLFGSMPFTATLVNSNLKWYKDHLVWDKNKCGSPGLAKVRPMRVHEDILIFAPGRTKYNPQMETGEPYKRKSKNPEGYVGRKNDHGYGLKPRTEFENEGTRYPKSIVSISRDFSAQQQVHAAQKPVPLGEWLIRTYSDEGDTVLDNAMGSGSFGIAARNCGRKFIGIEREPNYFQIAQNRIEDARRAVEGEQQ